MEYLIDAIVPWVMMAGVHILSVEHRDALDRCEFRDQLWAWGFKGEDPEGDYLHHCDKEHAGLIPRRFTKTFKGGE
jgi:hypothetical protein